MAVTFRAFADTTPLNTAIEHVVPASFQIQRGWPRHPFNVQSLRGDESIVVLWRIIATDRKLVFCEWVGPPESSNATFADLGENLAGAPALELLSSLAWLCG